MMTDIRIRSTTSADRTAMAAVLTESWGDTTVIAHGTSYDAIRLSALVAERDDEVAGLLTYTLADGALEIVTLDAVERHAGVGTALLTAAVDLARQAGANRVWLVTTNDNLDALRFYQRRGMAICAVARGAVDTARTLEPAIPEVGAYGIAIHDELTLEMPC
ncbi:GNAT family N-acetyltransferase [Nocardia terpenica]|uniref:GNAT family N-acetyltransferase n=1 Tax=Nocardia terpenica TaxID=455432 RepID=UPI002FE0E6C3